MPKKWVEIHNPKLKKAGTSIVTQAAFDRVWKARGFKIVPDDGGKK